MLRFILTSFALLSVAQASDTALLPREKNPLGLRVDIAPEYAERQFDWNEWVQEKFLEPLVAKEKGVLHDNTLYLSGQLRGSLITEKSNRADKFPLLSRFPAQHNGTTGSRFTINNAIFGTTATIGGFATFTTETIFTEVEYPGQTTTEMRRAFLTIGDLKKSPLYLGFGKNFVDFGDFGSYNPFTHTMNAHYFQVQSSTPVGMIGFYKNGLHIAATAIQGGRQLRVADSSNPSHLNNFALNINKTFMISDKATLKLGAGYLHNTIYNTLIPHHTVAQAAGQKKVDNPAYDLNATFTYKNFDVMAEYTSTMRSWLASDHIVQALTVQGRYKTKTFNKDTAFSLGYGKGVQGAPGTNFEQMTQVVAGVQMKFHPQVTFGAEYLYNQGFVPLMALRQTGDQSVEAHSVIMGGKLHF